MNRSQFWSIAAFIKKPNNIGAGPFIVIETDVMACDKSNPEYNFLASSRQQILTPALPIFP